MAEGKITKIRILGPRYLEYDPNEDSFSTNYTLDGSENNGVTFEKGPAVDGHNNVGIPTDIKFLYGLKFADFVSINFSLSVDPRSLRPVLSGIQETAAVFNPLCIQNVFEGYPSNNDSAYVSCGTLTSRPFTSDESEGSLILTHGNQSSVIYSNLTQS